MTCQHLPLYSQVPSGLPSSLKMLTAPCYVHRTAQWKVATLLGLALAVIVGALAWGVWEAYRGAVSRGEMAFGLFLLLFLAALMRPSVWRAPVVMAADCQGIHFVGSNNCVLVPWQEIGPLTVERAMVNNGVSETVIVALSTTSGYWDAAKKSGFAALLMGTEKPAGFLRVPLGNQGIDPQLTKRCLEELRSLAGHPNAWQDFSPGTQTRAWELVVGGAFFLGVALFFGIMMARSAVLQGELPGIGLALPLGMGAGAMWIIHYGWRKRPLSRY